jgi:uncharacterized membrane protein
MKITWNKWTAIVIILFTLLYWNGDQKNEAAMVFVAGSLNLWVIATISFLFKIKMHSRITERARVRRNGS